MTDCVRDTPNLKILRCTVCRFLGTDLDHWRYPYQGTDYYENTTSLSPVATTRPCIRHRVDGIKQHISGGRAVDIGCGLGETAIELGRQGYAAEGVDESAKAINLLRSACPEVKWHQGRIEEFCAAAEPQSYDVLSLYHVLEHIPHPDVIAQSLLSLLRPGGLLIVEVPDVGGGQARRLGWSWRHWLPHHVNYFSVSTLQRMFSRYGANLLRVERKYHFGYPQAMPLKDSIHGLMAVFGYNDIITTYWRKDQ